MRRITGFLMGLCLCLAAGARAEVPSSSLPGDAVLAEAVADIDKASAGRHVILLGEWHGTVQTPALAAQLAGHIARAPHVPVVLALEIADDQQASLDAWLASDGGIEARERLLANRHWQEPNHDGRDSRAMLDMLVAMRTLRERGLAVRVHAFDHPQADDRDAAMADDIRALLAGHTDTRVIVLTGNMHAMTRRPPWTVIDARGRVIEPPVSMGRHLADLAPLSIQVDAVRGHFVACLQTCNVVALPDRGGKTGAGLQETAAGESAWERVLTLPVLEASPPAIATD